MTDKFKAFYRRDLMGASLNVTRDGYSYLTVQVHDVNQARAIRDALNKFIGESAPDTARLTEVTKQAVEAVQNNPPDDIFFNTKIYDSIDQQVEILFAANVTDERDAVELAILIMAAIAEAFEPGGAK